MSSCNEVLACHREIAAAVARMLQLARAGQWCELPALEARCDTLVARLRGMEAPPGSQPQRRELAALAARVRADQAALAALVQPAFLRLVRRLQAQEPAGAPPGPP